jgi:hypothetical protein
MKTIIALLCLILTACAAPQPTIHMKMNNPIPPMPGSLRMACKPIPEFPDKVTMGVLFEEYNDLVDLYTLCRLANQAKIDWATSNGL